MTHIELKIYRRFLFYTVTEAAQWVIPRGVSNRVWQMWEKGDRKIPAEMGRWIFKLLNFRAAVIEDGYKCVDSGPEIKQHLPWFETLEDWASLGELGPIYWRPYCSALAHLLDAEPRKFPLIVFDEANYFDWLHERTDSWEHRLQWAYSVREKIDDL